MAQLHKRLGENVTISFGTPADAPVDIPPTRLRIVGTATFPAIGFASTVSDHTSMGTGVLIPFQALPKAFVAAVDGGPDPALDGPNLVLVRFERTFRQPRRSRVCNTHRRGSGPRICECAGRICRQCDRRAGRSAPAEIANHKTIGLTPAILVAGLVLGATAALALTLVASVRQRRRDFALLKTIGFVRHHLAAAVAWQATTVAVVGILVGIPRGIVVGRWLWDLFAEQINAVPDPSVSVPSVVLVALGTVLLANVVASLPAGSAARTPTAIMLRAE